MSLLRVKGWAEPAEQTKRRNRYAKLLQQAQDTLLQAFLVLRPIVGTSFIRPSLEVIDVGDTDDAVFVEAGRVYRLTLQIRLFTQEVVDDKGDGLPVYESFRYTIHQGNEKDAEARVLTLLMQAGLKAVSQILKGLLLGKVVRAPHNVTPPELATADTDDDF